MTNNNYLLLTPGPLTTSKTVKEAMLFDSCTWDDDYNLGVVQNYSSTISGTGNGRGILRSCFKEVEAMRLKRF